MTKLLEAAMLKARALPQDRQDALARLVLDEIESSRAWDERFEKSADKLESLATQVLDRDRKGESLDKDWDQL